MFCYYCLRQNTLSRSSLRSASFHPRRAGRRCDISRPSSKRWIVTPYPVARARISDYFDLVWRPPHLRSATWCGTGTEASWCSLAHAADVPLYPLAQGACTAIEDGLCPAEPMMRRRATLPGAFGAFHAARLICTARVELGSWVPGSSITPKASSCMCAMRQLLDVGRGVHERPLGPPSTHGFLIPEAGRR